MTYRTPKGKRPRVLLNPRHRCKRHLGVVLVHHQRGWEARWTDPATRRRASVFLGRLGLTTEEAGCSWALEKKRSLAKEREALSIYGAVPTDLTIDQAVEAFVRTARDEGKAERTLLSRRDRLAAFQDWARSTGNLHVARLSLGVLKNFRSHVLTLTARRKPKGECRKGKGRQGDRPLSGIRKKMILKQTAALLRDAAPHLPSDAVNGVFNTKQIKGQHKPIVILRDVREVRQTLRAALKYDAENSTLVAPMVLGCLLAGFRGMDFERLSWDSFEPDARDDRGLHGVIRIPEWHDKKRARTVGLGVSPVLKRLLVAMRPRAGGEEFIFGVSEDRQQFLMKRLRQHGAPPNFSWRVLRRTCASVSFSARDGVFQGNIFLPAKRLGHSVLVAEKHYATPFPGLDPEATTLEGAMKIEDLADEVVASVQPQIRKRRGA